MMKLRVKGDKPEKMFPFIDHFACDLPIQRKTSMGGWVNGKWGGHLLWMAVFYREKTSLFLSLWLCFIGLSVSRYRFAQKLA